MKRTYPLLWLWLAVLAMAFLYGYFLTQTQHEVRDLQKIVDAQQDVLDKILTIERIAPPADFIAPAQQPIVSRTICCVTTNSTVATAAADLGTTTTASSLVVTWPCTSLGCAAGWMKGERK